MNNYFGSVNKVFFEVGNYIRTIDFVHSNYLANIKNYYYIIYVIVMVLLCAFIKRIFKRTRKVRNERKYKTSENSIVEEVHYAACYCRDNPSLIPRCIALLSKYPKICNAPMPVHNYTPFLRACWNGCPELISFMLRIGADISRTTDAGENGIYLATYCYVRRNENTFEALKMLIAAGLDINQARYDGYTPLHLAASQGHSRLVRWLLAQGANPEPRGRPTASRVALACGYPKIASMVRLSHYNEHSII